jgi:YjbR protein
LTHNDFRRIALALSDAVEGAHMGHPDFRVQNRIFATIHTDPHHGMVKLTPEQQQAFVRDFPKVFAPESGAWGRGGSTRVIFVEADEELVGEVMTLAWQNVTNAPTARRPTRSTPKARRASPKPPKRQKP